LCHNPESFLSHIPDRITTQLTPYILVLFLGSIINNDKFTIPFSPNLNCLIGGRGSGKSAMIEAISFSLDSNNEFNRQAELKEKEQEDWYKRAAVTLMGCKIKICWISSKSSFDILQKKSLFLDRYFSSDNNYAQSDYRDITGSEVTNEEIKSDCKIQLFRMGTLEKLAVNDKDMRELFDKICGNEIIQLGNDIDLSLKQLKGQKQSIKQVFQKLSDITKDGSPLRKYVVRKKQYDDVNTQDMKEKYEKLDQATTAKQIASQAKQTWDDYEFATIINELNSNASSFFDDIEKKTQNDDGKIVTNTEELRNALLDKGDKEKSLKEEFISNVNILTGSITKTSYAIESAYDSIGTIEKNEKDSLVKAGMPSGSKERDVKRTLFNEATQALQEYENSKVKLRDLYQKRLELFKQLEGLARKRTQLRDKTAKDITNKLSKNLDSSVLVIEADARAMADKKEFNIWLDKCFFPSGSQSKSKRIESLLDKGLLPEEVRKLLFDSGDPRVLVVNENMKVSEGKIDIDTAKQMIEYARICHKFIYEDDIQAYGIRKEDLPDTIQKGIMVFTEEQNKIEALLQLDEIVFDDIPEIRLKDRPSEMPEARPITALSAGQRCSAILPIILLNGDCPLIIDQPEDNLDNRLIREVVVNILAAMKLRRQVIMATHNPNLPVLGSYCQMLWIRFFSAQQRRRFAGCLNLFISPASEARSEPVVHLASAGG